MSVTYATDRLTFRRKGALRIAVVDGVDIVTLEHTWMRSGGWGWHKVGSTEGTERTLLAAARSHIVRAVIAGRIVNRKNA